MGLGILAMSAAERERAFLTRQIVQQLLSQKAVAERLGIGVRQVKRLVRAYRCWVMLACYAFWRGICAAFRNFYNKIGSEQTSSLIDLQPRF